MYSFLLVVAVLIILGLSTVWAMFRGLAKARIRGISVLVCAILAVVITLLTRNSLLNGDLVNETILPLLQESENAQIIELLQISQTLNITLLNVVVSLITPLMCLVIFMLLSFITWIAFLVVTMVFSQPLSDSNDRAVARLPRSIVWGVVQGLAVVAIVLLPISSYAEVGEAVISGVVESGMIQEEADEEALRVTLEETVKPLNSGFVSVYRALGGKALCNSITDFEVNEQKVHLADEVDSIASFAGNIIAISQSKMAEYGAYEASQFRAMADSFDESVLLPTIAGEIVYNVTDKWQNGGTFMGAAKPSMGEMGGLVDPFFNTLLDVLHDDSVPQRTEALQADIHTVGEMVALLAEKNVFANMSNPDEMLTALGGDGVVTGLVTLLGQNESMKVLVPEITYMGVRAISSTLGIPADYQEVHGKFMDDVAYALNKTRNLPEDQQVDTLTTDLKKSFDEAGIKIDPELINCFAVSMINDIVEPVETTTVADVEDFFSLLSEDYFSQLPTDPTEGVAFVELKDDNGNHNGQFKGNAYKNKTEEELNKSGAVALKKAYDELEKEQSTGDAAVTVLVKVYAEVLGENDGKMEKIAKVKLTAAVTKESVQITASLKSSDTMISTKVTMQQLIGDSKEAASHINSENIAAEAAAVSAIINAATNLSGQFKHNSENMDLAVIAETVGEVLNGLNTSPTYGEEKTADLFTAVFQSETVRKTADIDMETATKMANAATDNSKGQVDYSKTMVAVSSSVTVITKLGKDGEELSEEELIKLIENINPQTAGMIEVYATPQRLEGYKVSPKYSGTGSELITNTFHYMGNENLENYDAEAKALNQILKIALTARDNSSEKHLYTNGDQKGILPGNATETVNTFMNSRAIAYGITTTVLDDAGNVKEGKQNAFDLAGKMNTQNGEYQETVNAMEAYYAEHQDEATRKELIALAALLGIEQTDLNF